MTKIHTEIEKLRVFIVGCPRSGTTLLQSMLASHPDLYSLPETHFFPTAISKCRLLRWCGLTNKRKKAKQKLLELGLNEIQFSSMTYIGSTKKVVEHFVLFLDIQAEKNSKKGWIEKTPRHLHYINYIEKYVPFAKFIHIIRRGQDVVASLYDVSHRYPETWGNRSISECIDRWVKDVRISLNKKSDANHYLIQYKQLVQNPSSILENLCTFLGLETYDYSLKNLDESYEVIRCPGADWTNGARHKRLKMQRNKFQQIFNNNQRKYIIETIRRTGLDQVK